MKEKSVKEFLDLRKKVFLTKDDEHKYFKDNLPKAPEGLGIELALLKNVPDPKYCDHYYTVGVKHVEFANEHHSGILGKEAIRAGEKQGITCEEKNCNLEYDDHKIILTLFMYVPDNKKLNSCKGLHDYLMSIKPECDKYGVGGFGFLEKKDQYKDSSPETWIRK